MRTSAGSHVGRRTPWAVPVVLSLVVVVWGAAFSGIKVLLETVGPYGLTAARLGIAAATYTAVLPFVRARPVERRPGDVWRLVAAGGFGTAGYHLAVNWGEQYLSAGLTSLLVASMPAMVAVLAAIVLRERLGPVRVAGTVVAFGGVALLAATSGDGIEARSLTGAGVTLLAPLSWSAYTLMAKPLAERYDGVRLNLLGSWAAVAIVTPLSVGELDDLVRLGAGGWLWLLYLGVLSTAAAYIAYAWALRRWTATAVASFIYLVPAVSLVWAWALLGEVPTPGSLAGGALVVIGVVVVQRARA